MLNHYKVSGCRELGKNTTFPEHLVPAVLVECFCFGDKVVVEGAGAAQQEVRQPVFIVLHTEYYYIILASCSFFSFLFGGTAKASRVVGKYKLLYRVDR